MGAYLLRRILFMIPTLLGITLLVFMLLALAPGGIGAGLQVQGGQMSDTSRVAQMQAYLEDRYGLNDPVIVQYGRWLARISPVKFGERDLRAPSGERVPPPRELDAPPLAKAFPPPAAPAVEFTPATGDDLVPQFKKLQRDAEGTRREYIGSVRLMREALADYARAVGPPLTERLDAKGGADFARFEEAQFDASLPAYAKLRTAAETAHAKWTAATAARTRALAAFRAGPYPPSGYPVIPGWISVDSPDLGVAFSKNRPVWDLIAAALPVTLLINLIAFPISYLVAVPTGVLASVRRGGWFDAFTGVLYLSLYSIPTVLAGVFAIGFLANKQYLGLFPVSGLHDTGAEAMTFLPSTDASGRWSMGWLLDLLWHVALPVLCLVYGSFAVLSKQTRAAMLDNFNADYVRTAKAKGVPRKDVVLRHVFRNSLLPLITMFVGIFPAMLAGSVVIERIFSIPGMGSLIIEAIDLRDREIILANTFMIACVNLLALLLADLLYAAADPRVSYD
ncbi:MAG: ABC transporter permease [Phycisphaerales bacterium]